MADFTKPFDDLTSEAKEYVNLQIDDLKLRTVKGLSVTLGRLLWMILLLFVISVVLLAAAFGLVVLLGDAIGSLAGAAFLVAGGFLVLAAVVWFLKDRIFTSSLVRMFAKFFFEDNSQDS